MANRYPLIIDNANQRIRELPSGDGLDLTGNSISAVRNIIPENTETYDLGSAQNRWKDLYLSGDTIFLGNAEIKFSEQDGIIFVVDGQQVGVQPDLQNNSTDDLSEGTTNLYFTTARARDSISVTGDLTYNPATGVLGVDVPEGYDSTDFDTDFGNKSTSDLTEGTNLYFTTGRIDSHLSGGTGVTYSNGSISIGQDVGTNADVEFNDAEVKGTATFSSTGAIVLPIGTTAQRPDPASTGMFRFNTDFGKFEGYDGVEWVEIQAGFTFEGDLDTLSGTEDLESGDGIVDLMD